MNRSMDYGSSSLALTSALLLASGDAVPLGPGQTGQMDAGGARECGAIAASLAGVCAGLPGLELLDTGGSASADAGQFSLLTYNVAGLPDAISPSHPATNIPLISPLLNYYDLALVQEDFYYHPELIGETRHAYRSERAVGFAMPGDGLAVLSRLVLGRTQRVRWSNCNGYVLDASDCLAEKGFSFGEVALAAGVTIHAYNLHADAGRSVTDEWVRRKNFEQLAEFIKARSAGHALIVAGDTNLHSSSPGDVTTLAHFLASNELEDACQGQRSYQDSIDRVLFRGSVHTELTVSGCRRDSRFIGPDGRALSDHPAIGVDVQWRRAPAARLVKSP